MGNVFYVRFSFMNDTFLALQLLHNRVLVDRLFFFAHTHRIWCTQHSDGPFQFWRYLWIATLWIRRPNVAGIVRLMYSNLEESKWINGTHDLNWAPKFVRKIPKSLAEFLTTVEMCRVLISSTQCDEISKEFTESEVFALKLLISDVP